MTQILSYPGKTKAERYGSGLWTHWGHNVREGKALFKLLVLVWEMYESVTSKGQSKTRGNCLNLSMKLQKPFSMGSSGGGKEIHPSFTETWKLLGKEW